MTDTANRQTRRELFRGVGRGAALAAAAALAWLLGSRAGASPGRPECGNSGPCHQCRAFDRCELEQARISRRREDRPHGE